MTPSQVQLIRSSWSAVEPISDRAATAFYARLFELDPRIAPLFLHTDMAKQHKVLMQTLTVVVKSLDKLDQIVPAVQALGRRHAGYGVEAHHYAQSAPLSSGRWSRALVPPSRRRHERPGRLHTARWPRS